ncbi:MAG TPA: KH domain-containing protein [Thermoplasmataceae archaeon]|nr:KH domain-containing protein [Thermoplasmataceae archaeon]
MSEDHPSYGIVRIPIDRVGALIGRGGKTKAQIENYASVELLIDSETGEVEVIGSDDPIRALTTVSVVQAIGRGFSPEKAIALYNDNYQLVVISLRDYAKPGSRRIQQIRARIIGTGGRTRSIIEELTSVHISVYGDTVSLIGDYVSVEYAKEAVIKLILGSKQRTVYTYLEKVAREVRLKRIEETFG